MTRNLSIENSIMMSKNQSILTGKLDTSTTRDPKAIYEFKKRMLEESRSKIKNVIMTVSLMIIPLYSK